MVLLKLSGGKRSITIFSPYGEVYSVSCGLLRMLMDGKLDDNRVFAKQLNNVGNGWAKSGKQGKVDPVKNLGDL